MKIPTYVINLESRIDRKAHIIKEFEGKHEFSITIVKACEHKIGAIGLWNTMKEIIQDASKEMQEYILICEDDHQFTDIYSIELLLNCIAEARKRNAYLLSGGPSWYKDALQVSDHVFWTSRFTGAQFIIVFRDLFQRILEAAFNEYDAADLKLCTLTESVFFVYPFLSVQKEFGYSDITATNNKLHHVEALFKGSAKNIQIMKQVNAFYKSITNTRISRQQNYQNIIIPTYIISHSDSSEIHGHIGSQFNDREEFQIMVVESCNTEFCLWKTVRDIISTAIRNEDDVIIICGEDHVFTDDYSKEFLIKNIIEANQQGADYLNGGVNKFDAVVPLSANRFWVNSSMGTQFIIVFQRFYRKILDAPFDEAVNCEILLSSITSNKMLLFPRISIRKSNNIHTDTNCRLEKLQMMRWEFAGDMTIAERVNYKLRDIATYLTAHQHLNTNNGLFHGKLGVVLFLLYYYKLTNHEIFYKSASAMIIECFEGFKEPHIAKGLSGIAWTIDLLFEEGIVSDSAVDVFGNNLYSNLHKEAIRALKQGNYDYLNGALGIMAYLVESDFDISESLALLIQLSDKNDVGINWAPIVPAAPGKKSYNLGMMHGNSGILSFLLKTYVKQGREYLIPHINQLIEFILSRKDVKAVPFGWCSGDPGIAYTLLQAAEVFSDNELHAKAMTMFYENSKRRDTAVMDACFCHGSAGISHIFSKIYQKTNDLQFKRAADYWLCNTLEFGCDIDGAAGYRTFREENQFRSLSLLDGISGIGLSLISSVSPMMTKWDKFFLLS